MFNEVKDEDYLNSIAQTIGREDLARITITNYYMKRIAESYRSKQTNKISGILEDYTKSINLNHEVYSDYEGGFFVEANIYTDGKPKTMNIEHDNEHIRILNGDYDSEDGIRETISKGDILEIEEYQGNVYDPAFHVEILEDIDDDGMTTFKTITKGLITNSILELPNTGDININENNTHWKRILE